MSLLKPINLSDDPSLGAISTMPPPTGLPQKRKVKQHKIILSEDDYVSKLEEIIERDYFPEISQLKTQLGLMEAYEKKDYRAVHELRRKILGQQLKSKGMAGDAHLSTTSDSTSVDGSIRDDKCPDLTVSSFFERYTSEDNASFEEIHAKDIELYRKKFHWVYESEDERMKAGMLMWYHLGGKVLSVDDRKKFDEILDGPTSRGDERPSSLESWPFRVRNQLMFQPQLEDSEKICRVDEQSALLCSSTSSSVSNALPSLALTGGDVKHIEDQKTENSMIALSARNRWVASSDILRAPKVIQPQNTNMRRDLFDPTLPSRPGASPLEAPHTPTTASEGFSDSSSDAGAGTGTRVARRQGSKTEYEYVQMTPLLLPESAGFSPLVTFGEICGTPICLDAPTIQTVGVPINEKDVVQFLDSLGIGFGISSDAGAAPRFEINPISRRELLARQLDARSSSKSKGGSSSSSSSKNAAAQSKEISYKLYKPPAGRLTPAIGARSGGGGSASATPQGGRGDALQKSSTGTGDESGDNDGDDESMCSFRTSRSRASSVHSAASSRSSSRHHSHPQLSDAAKALAAKVYGARVAAAATGGGAGGAGGAGTEAAPFGGSAALFSSYSGRTHSKSSGRSSSSSSSSSSKRPRLSTE